ncbi:hypothetical protein Mal52_12920 [Symmachiella dynata]|uniref:Transcobalamin-like C-terminal domain-containing protein n=1 Tax=Symmachiella dynata TaxID=2527995 RepID=A0A517ZK03_9PLAN|nr:hypothetical protein Mal52_12920 [Symmachiella dynata]
MQSCLSSPRLVSRRRVCAIVVFVGIAAILPGNLGQIVAADPEPLSVKLIIDYNDGVEKHFTAIPWKKGMTVMDAMRYAKRGKHGIDFKFSGNGDTAFLTQIDDLKNEGGGEGKKNWILRVNKKLATESFGVFELKSGDVIRWQFEVFKL